MLNEFSTLLKSIHKTEAVEYLLDVLVTLSKDSEAAVRQTLAENLDTIMAYYLKVFL